MLLAKDRIGFRALSTRSSIDKVKGWGANAEPWRTPAFRKNDWCRMAWIWTKMVSPLRKLDTHDTRIGRPRRWIVSPKDLRAKISRQP